MLKANPAILLLAISLALPSCKRDEEIRSDLAAANDRIQALNLNNQTLSGENDRIKQDFTNLTDSLRKTYETEKGTILEASRQRLAVLESEGAELQMRFSVSERQRLALQDAIDQPGRLKILQDNNFAMERMVWIAAVFLCIIPAVVVALKYHGMRRNRRENIVRLVSELSNNPEFNG